MNKQRLILRTISALFIAGFISFFLAQNYFAFESRALVDRLFLVVVPAAAIFTCLLYLIPALETTLVGVSPFVRWFVFGWSIFSAGLFAFLSGLSFLSFLFFLILFTLTLIPSASSLQTLQEAGGRSRILGAWIFASIFSFFLTSFLDDFYTSAIELIILIILSQASFGIGGYFFMGRARRVAGERWFDAFIHFSLFALLISFILWSFNEGQVISIFPSNYFLLNQGTKKLFTFFTLLALPWQGWLHIKLKFSGFYNRLKQTKIYEYISANLAGLSLAFAFFTLYLVLASALNLPRFDVDDIYFDADHFNYRLRLTSDHWNDFYWRSVHPFIVLLLRPLVGLFAILLKGDALWGAYVLVALGGAACVYLVWMFIKSVTGNSVYASLISALLGLSASHLVFGSLLESYIFLAASLLLFFMLLLKDRPLPALVSASLITVGLTHSNFAQNVIALFTVKPNIKQMFKYGVTVMVFLVLLTLANNILYPDAHPFFFVPSSLQAEESNLYPLNQLRGQALIRAFFFHNIAAPDAILHTGEIPFVQFRFFKPEINKLSQYDLPLQNMTSWIWALLLLLGGSMFLLNFRKDVHLRLSLALIGCMGFNFLLHLRYGKELFLYTPNWTYALILLLGMAWRQFAGKRWFQLALLVFLFLLVWNNAALITTIFETLAVQV